MSDETGAPAEGTAAPESTSGPDFSPVLDRVDQLASGLDGLQSSFQQFVQAQQPAPEPEPDPWADFLGAYGQQEPEPVQQPGFDPGMFQQAVDARVQQMLGQTVAPLQQGLQSLQQQAALGQIYRDLPQLADNPQHTPEQRQQVMQARQEVAQQAQQAVQAYPPHIQQALLNDPQYITTIVKAAEADKLARAQVPAESQVHQLEAAGGAHPGGDGQQQSIVQQAHENRWQLPAAFR